MAPYLGCFWLCGGDFLFDCEGCIFFLCNFAVKGGGGGGFNHLTCLHSNILKPDQNNL